MLLLERSFLHGVVKMKRKRTSSLAAFFILIVALLSVGCNTQNVDTPLPPLESLPAEIAPNPATQTQTSNTPTPPASVPPSTASNTSVSPASASPTPVQPTPTKPAPIVEETDAEPKDLTVAITDVLGRIVVLPKPVNKLVGTHNQTLNIAIILGGGGKYIAGFGNKKMVGNLYEYVYPELERVTQVGIEMEINQERVIEIDAQLAILPERHAAIIEQFENVGIPAAVIFSNNESFETIKNCIELLGKLVGADGQATAINNFVDKKINVAQELTRQTTKKTTALFLGDSSPLFVANAATLQAELLDTAGAINLAKDVRGKGGYIKVRASQITKWNPEVIYIPAYAQYTVDDVLNNRAWRNVKAVQNGRVYVFPSTLEPWDYPNPSAAIGLMWLLNNLYPELYSKEQVLSDANEYYNLVYSQTFNAQQLGLG